jgi:hypothetical protein
MSSLRSRPLYPKPRPAPLSRFEQVRDLGHAGSRARVVLLAGSTRAGRRRRSRRRRTESGTPPPSARMSATSRCAAYSGSAVRFWNSIVLVRNMPRRIGLAARHLRPSARWRSRRAAAPAAGRPDRPPRRRWRTPSSCTRRAPPRQWSWRAPATGLLRHDALRERDSGAEHQHGNEQRTAHEQLLACAPKPEAKAAPSVPFGAIFERPDRMAEPRAPDAVQAVCRTRKNGKTCFAWRSGRPREARRVLPRG